MLTTKPFGNCSACSIRYDVSIQLIDYSSYSQDGIARSTNMFPFFPVLFTFLQASLASQVKFWNIYINCLVISVSGDYFSLHLTFLPNFICYSWSDMCIGIES